MRRNIKSTEDYTQSCTVCKNDAKDETDNILLCDKCDNGKCNVIRSVLILYINFVIGFHLSCLSPPLTAVPSGFWFCNSCKEKLEEGVSDDIVIRLNEQWLTACLAQE
jgi:ribosomal protein L37AE/L43A